MTEPFLSLVQADFGDGPPRPGILGPDGVLDLSAAAVRLPGRIPAAAGVAPWIARGRARHADFRAWWDALRAKDPGPRLFRPDARLLLPFRPGKVLAVGRNYAAHAEELGNAVPGAPFLFAKLPSTAIGPGRAVVIPCDLGGEVHHEAELAVVIGRSGRRIPRERALDYVGGYLCANDVTARTLQLDLKERRLPWFAGKNLDTFLPLGPGVVPADAIPDPSMLRVQCLVNGELRQDGAASLMRNDVAALVAHASRHLTLEPLDVILTGTPAGVGPLAPGDTVEVRIPGIGSLTNPVLSE